MARPHRRLPGRGARRHRDPGPRASRRPRTGIASGSSQHLPRGPLNSSSSFARLAEALKDRYTLDREIGQGGMATVYLAEDIRHRRKVAVKVLRPELAASLGPDRFLREIEIAARLQHPHILPLLDSGESDGLLYYIMPFIEGESLRARLSSQGQLPIHEAARILREVADALAYAHGRGLVHRDIKPDNILLSGNHALVADFGIARAVRDAAGATALTGTGISLELLKASARREVLLGGCIIDRDSPEWQCTECGYAW
ncbi:MAG TPA: serine/threonine-protein kinase, partial [Gemmatimonadales bacterium]|nr:serine/threonine-protein kinase [Gemmatimonadales bacterium]